MTNTWSPDTILVADRIYIPVRKVAPQKVRRAFERRLFNDKKCKSCQVYQDGDRYLHDICGPCPAHKGFYRTWAPVRLHGKDYVAVPAGNPEFVSRALDIKFENVVDLRSDVPARFPLTFTKSLHDGSVVDGVATVDQKKVLRDFTRYCRGMILARPRSGKTVMAVRLLCYLKRRIVIIAHEEELLKQFYRTLVKFTNLNALEKQHGRTIAGIVFSPADLKRAHAEKWDIVLTTYQRFIREETGIAQLNKYIRGCFGAAIVDEAHRGNASSYAAVLNKIDSKFKIALTATRERKDRLEFIMDQILGPVRAEANSIGMTPIVTVHETNFTMDYEPKGMTAYNKITRAMAEDGPRNSFIVKAIFEDLRANPKHCIVVPVLFVEHAHRLTALINRYGQYLKDTTGEQWDINLAMAYHRGVNKDAVLRAAREGKSTRVIIGIRSKVTEGIDVLPWTHMILQFPMNNFANFYQLTNRILTPYAGKPQPRLRIIVDRVGLSLGCLNATWYNGVVKYKYWFDPKTQRHVDFLATIKETKATGKGRKGKKMLTGRVGRSW